MLVSMDRMNVVNVLQDNMLLDLHHQANQLMLQVANFVKLEKLVLVFQLHNVSMKLSLVFFVEKADTRIKRVKLVAHRAHPVNIQLEKVKLVQTIVTYVHQIHIKTMKE